MYRTLVFLLFVLAFGLAVSAQAATIIWVSDAYDDDNDSVKDDLGFVTLLRSRGYTVDYRGETDPADPVGYWRTLDATKLALLNSADLVIVSRNAASGEYANNAAERAAWNGVTAPLILEGAHIYRNTHWRWLNTTSTTNTTDNLLAVLPDHPVFSGVTLTANQVSVVNATTSVGDNTVDPANNYTLIAVRATAGADGVWIAFWEPALEFYPGSGERTGGPRMYFACGTQETVGSVGRGSYNLTTEGEKLYLNAVDYMIKWQQVNASQPIPANGAAVPPTGKVTGGVYMLLTFTAGETAISHTAYFSADFDDVNDRNPAVNLGSPPYPDMYPTGYYVGFNAPEIPAFARAPLTAGKTYYWVVDESDGVSTFPGKVWSFKIVPEQAWDPSPADGAKYVDARTGVALSWKLGSISTTGYNVSYDVYYGTAFADVNTGTTPTVHVTAAATTTAPLASQTLYYWRVDTKLNYSNPPFALYTTIKGDVWRFETLLVVPVTDPNLVGWWKLDGDFESFVFDHSGHANHGTAQGGVGWVAGYNGNAADFDGANDYVELPRNIVGSAVGTMAMWIRTTQSADGTIFYGTQTDGDGYGTQNEVHVNVVPGGGARLYIQGSPSVSLISSAVNDNEWHHIAAAWDTTIDARLYVDGGSAGATAHTGSVFPAAGYVRLGRPASATRYYDGLLDDVRLYDYALSAKTIKVLAGRLTAASPDPANIATGVARTPTLSWEAGAYAANVNGHNLYFSDNRDSVINRTTAKIVRTDPCYPVATILDLGKTYYWAVDEVNGLDVWPGDLWSFTTVNYLVVDDMEKYVPNVANPTVYQVWVDGAGDCASIPGNNSGALVDISTLAALTPVHGGQQAMKLMYDNDGTVDNPCPPGGPTARLTYSKAEAQVAKLASGIGSDWTTGGVTKALSLWFYGDPLNSIEPMWVQLTDASNNKAKVLYSKYADENVNDVNEASWHEWLIDLDDFNVPPTRVNIKNVKSIAIGIGNETGPAGGSGTLYFDDIRLYTPRCVLTRRSADFAPFDYVGDCKVDYRELERMTSQWLVGPEAEVAWAPFGTWSHADIGSTATAGGFIDNGDGSYSITGSGADIWGTADAFHYVYKPLVGDGQMTVNVVSIAGTSTNEWQKAGVMIRETLAAGSRNVMMLMSAGGASANFGGGDAFQWRPVTDQASSSSHLVCDNIEVLPPNCVRLVRTGNMFSGFVYVNGQWVQEGQTVTIAMPETVYIGLAVTSHDNAAGIYTTAMFNSVCDSSFGGLLPDLTGGDDRVNFVDYAALVDRFLDEDFFP